MQLIVRIAWQSYCFAVFINVFIAYCFAVTYTATFTGLNCDGGLPLMQASSAFLIASPESNVTASAAVARVQKASDRLDGSVLVAFQGSQWEPLSVNASARSLKSLLLQLGTSTCIPLYRKLLRRADCFCCCFPAGDSVEVSRDGDCSEYK